MKTALISGGTSGIGKGMVLRLLEDGFKVATFSRNKEGCEKLTKELSAKYSKARFLVLEGDVTDSGSLEPVVNKTKAKFGRIDILINNAGFGYFEDADKVDIEKFEAMADVNLIGVARLTKLVLPYMKKAKSGLIINLSSVSGKMAAAKGEFYSATKFGLMGYSEGLREEVKDFGIKVSTVCPGMINTDFFIKKEKAKRLKKHGFKNSSGLLQVEDIAKIISFICNQSPQSEIQDILVMPFA